VLVGSRHTARACGPRSTTLRCPGGRAWATRGGLQGLPRPRPASRGIGPSAAGQTPRRATTISTGQLLLQPRHRRCCACHGPATTRRGPHRAVPRQGDHREGLDLLLAAWPLVLQRLPDARLVVVGFGAWHPTAMRMTTALADNDLESGSRDRRTGPRRRAAREAAALPAHVPRLAEGRNPTAFPRRRARHGQACGVHRRLEHEE
jgi:hypothetical protein